MLIYYNNDDEGEWLINDFFSLPPQFFTAIATVVGFALDGNLTYDQQNSLGNFLALLGQILMTNSAQHQLLEGVAQEKRLDQLEKEIAQLHSKLSNEQP